MLTMHRWISLQGRWEKEKRRRVTTQTVCTLLSNQKNKTSSSLLSEEKKILSLLSHCYIWFVILYFLFQDILLGWPSNYIIWQLALPIFELSIKGHSGVPEAQCTTSWANCKYALCAQLCILHYANMCEYSSNKNAVKCWHSV